MSNVVRVLAFLVYAATVCGMPSPDAALHHQHVQQNE